MAALGADSGISKSKVSRICAELDETVEASAAAASTTQSPQLRFA